VWPAAVAAVAFVRVSYEHGLYGNLRVQKKPRILWVKVSAKRSAYTLRGSSPGPPPKLPPNAPPPPKNMLKRSSGLSSPSNVAPPNGLVANPGEDPEDDMPPNLDSGSLPLRSNIARFCGSVPLTCVRCAPSTYGQIRTRKHLKGFGNH
jgi:hypothetical protein